ncbi:MAG: hypothetical protein IKE70_02710 [Bacilli bacterium]|nr:hypothetical protein [Bacilli bacterium]
MRDSIGSSIVIVIIVVFIVFAMGYLAFNVNYTKAFRMKNKILSVYKEYNGICTDNCEEDIKDYANRIGYKPSGSIKCPSCEGGTPGNSNYYCWCRYSIAIESDDTKINDLGDRFYYHVVTKINMDIPVLSNMIDLQVFNISGDTEVFTK